MTSLITSAKIESKIHVIRNTSVMLDRDLANLYGVSTGNLNLAVKRNIKRFPSDFMFKLSFAEARTLILQFETSNGRGGTRKPPSAFTEQGVAMLSSVLNSPRAIQVNIQIMRAFIHLRGFHFSYAELRRDVQTMRKKYDGKFAWVFKSLEALMDGPKKKVDVKGFV
jgi:hypothetical protein